jgi:CheY-specific phosphatase CheX
LDQPDSEHIREAFLTATQTTLREMIGVEAVPGDSGPQTAQPSQGIAALIPLTTPAGSGSLLLCCPEPTAAVLARRYLAEYVGEPDAALVRDCVGEIANVIAGQAKGILSGTPDRFSFSPPRDVSEDPSEPQPPRADCLTLAFQSDVGPFSLQVRFHQL